MTRITGILHAEQYKFLLKSRSVLLRKINVSAKSSRENQNTFYVPWIFFCENWAVYEIIWKSTILDRQATDYNTAHAPCIVDNYSYKHAPRTHLKVTFKCTLPVLYRNKRKQNDYLHFNTLRTGSFKLFKRPFPGFLKILTL